MEKILENLLNASFSRRDFIKGTAAATAAVTGLSLGAGAKESAMAYANAPAAETVAPAEHLAIVDCENEGKWITASC